MKPIKRSLYGTDPYAGFDTSWAEPDLQGWGHEHGIFSASIKRVKPKVIVEVGTWKGASAIHMGKLCRELGYDAEIVCVDTFLGPHNTYMHTDSDSHRERLESLRSVNGFPMLYYTFLRNVVDAGLQDTITPLPQTSEHAAKTLRHLRVRADIVYLDAAREKEAVARDLNWFWPLLRKGGHMIGNDFKNDAVREGTEKFAARMKIDGPEGLGGKFRFVKP